MSKQDTKREMSSSRWRITMESNIFEGIEMTNPYFDVAVIEPDRALILRGDMPGEQTITITWIWLFYLTPLDEKSTRLIIRSRLVYEPTLGNFLSWRVFTDPISFMMERKTLQGIKVRAEATTVN